MEFKPLRERVCILPDPKKEKTEGGLLIHDRYQKDEGRGTVKAVSVDIEFPGFKEGDRVMYGTGRIFPIQEEGIEYHVVPIDDVILKYD